jgi:trehalose/maltose hydrolase-like predicted phosphorylase
MLRLTVCLLVFVSSISAYAQSNDEGKVIIKYDPLFWKDQLKLSASQSSKIKDINVAYYEKLKIVSTSQLTTGNARNKVEEFLEERSNEIWNTFHSRQKRKWMKMWSESKNG